MQRILKPVLVFLMVLAFGAATISATSALPCAEHSGNPLHQGIHPGLTVAHADPGPAPGRPAGFAQGHFGDGKCCHPCCVSPTSATVAGVVGSYVALNIRSAAFPPLQDTLLMGIGVAPLTGPPKPPV